MPGLGRSPGKVKGLLTPVFRPGEFQVCIVHGAAKNSTRLSDFHFHSVPEVPGLSYVQVFVTP